MDAFFPYDLDWRYQLVWRPLGVTERDGVTVGDEVFVATFGRVRIETARSNIADCCITGPYRPWKAVGMRLSLVDSGITFGTTSRRGVCVLFHEPVRGIIGTSPHAGLTVTVADPEGLVECLSAD